MLGGMSRSQQRPLATIDECTSSPHNCVTNSKCQNTVGSFSCVCDAGYIGDGRTNCYVAINAVQTASLTGAIVLTAAVTCCVIAILIGVIILLKRRLHSRRVLINDSQFPESPKGEEGASANPVINPPIPEKKIQVSVIATINPSKEGAYENIAAGDVTYENITSDMSRQKASAFDGVHKTPMKASSVEDQYTEFNELSNKATAEKPGTSYV